MKIAVLGTGAVGKSIATRLAQVGHDVTMGSRTADNAEAVGWAGQTGANASNATFADAAAAADVIFLCSKGEHARSALDLAGAANLAGKPVVDLTNPLDFGRGFPPRLTVCNDDSSAEQLQRAFPDAHVVKTLNMMSHVVMVDPARLGQETAILLAGNDAAARQTVTGILQDFGWAHPIDLGDLTAARGMEAWLLLWPRLYQALGTGDFNIAIVTAAGG